MIITTKRPARIFITDTIITGLAWLAFIYQFTNGVIFLLSEHPAVSLPSFYGVTLSATTSTLLVCVIVCAFNALLVYLWARLRDTPEGHTHNHQTFQELSSNIIADHFSLSPRQIDDVRDSRVTVVYHSSNGGITHLEMGDLQLQEITHPMPAPVLRVA